MPVELVDVGRRHSIAIHWKALRGKSIPQVTIKTGIIGPDGREEQLTEYICDYPGCPNIATHLLGVIVELRIRALVCDEHLPKQNHT